MKSPWCILEISYNFVNYTSIKLGGKMKKLKEKNQHTYILISHR